MTLSTLSLVSPPRRPIIIIYRGSSLAEIDKRWPKHWDLVLLDSDVRSEHHVIDDRSTLTWTEPFIEEGYEVLSYEGDRKLPYIPLDREMRIIERVPEIVSRYLDRSIDASKIGEVEGDVDFDRGTIRVTIYKAALAELIGLEQGEKFLVSIEPDLCISITPIDPLDGNVDQADSPNDFDNRLHFFRLTGPGEWLPELPERTLRFTVLDDRSLVSDPILHDTLRPPAAAPLSMFERVTLVSPATGDLVMLSMVTLLGALG